MAPSSTSLPNSPLPFGADTHNHNAFRRSTTDLGVPHSNAQHDQQDYKSFIVQSQVNDARSRRASASIAPSSLKDLPLGHRKLLRRHRILLWVVSAVFEISLIALTTGIVLCAVRAHEYNADGGGKAAFVIVGVFGFAGMVSSAAVGWWILQGRQERARLEKKWTADEEMKERRSLRERSREHAVLGSIRNRERSLESRRSRSRDRGRTTHRSTSAPREGRAYSELIPSFRDLTPTGTEAASVATQTRETDNNQLQDESASEDEEFTRANRQLTNERLEQEIFEHMSRPTTPGTPPPDSPNINRVLLASSPTLLNSSSTPADGPEAALQRANQQSHISASSPQSPTLFDFTNINGPPPSPPPKSLLPPLPPVRSSARPRPQPPTPASYGQSPSTMGTSILNTSPPIGGAADIYPIYRSSNTLTQSPVPRGSERDESEARNASLSDLINSFPAVPRSSRHIQSTGSLRPQLPISPVRGRTQSSELLHFSSANNIDDGETHPAFRNAPPTRSPEHVQRALQNTNIATATAPASASLPSSSTQIENPLSSIRGLTNRHHAPSSPPSPRPTTTTFGNLHNTRSTYPPPSTPPKTALPPIPRTPYPQAPNTPPPPSPPSPPIFRAQNAPLGPTQSDDTFLAMLDAGSNAGSEDEARLAVRRARSRDVVGAWAARNDAEGSGTGVREGGRGRSGERGGGAGRGRERGRERGGRSGYLTGREEDASGIVRRGWRGVGEGWRKRFSPKLGSRGPGVGES